MTVRTASTSGPRPRSPRAGTGSQRTPRTSPTTSLHQSPAFRDRPTQQCRDQAVEQAAYLGSGQRDRPAMAGVVPGIGGRGRCRGGGACHEEGQGEHCQGNKPVPGGPSPHLIVVQPDLQVILLLLPAA